MAAGISLSEFMQVNGMDARAGFARPMKAGATLSVQEFIRKRTPVWNPTVKGLFTHEDIHHMQYGDEDDPPGPKTWLFNLADIDATRERARDILDRVSTTDWTRTMPPPPKPGEVDRRWTGSHIDLFHRWLAGGMPE
jgi:hypothetical protein